jgi:hypothetical protein
VGGTHRQAQVHTLGGLYAVSVVMASAPGMVVPSPIQPSETGMSESAVKIGIHRGLKALAASIRAPE